MIESHPDWLAARRHPRHPGRLRGAREGDRRRLARLPRARVTPDRPTRRPEQMHGCGMTERRLAAVLVNGGTARLDPGTWSATSELLARELAPRFPEIAFVEVRYRIKSWKALDGCIEDAQRLSASPSAEAQRLSAVGFSMGGAVSIGVAGHEAVSGVLGLSPWIPARLSLTGLRGKRLDVLQGGLDRALPGIPGISPASSRAGFERARALGVEGSYELDPRRSARLRCPRPFRRLVRLPRWRAWVDGCGGRPGELSGLGGEPSPRELTRVRQLHVPGEPETLERADRPPGDVELEPVEAVTGRAREGVVVVVPALAHRQHRDDPVVSALVA